MIAVSKRSPERVAISVASLAGILADEYLEARRIIECLSGVAAMSSSDTQAVAPNERLELSRKVHLEIQRPDLIGLTSNFSDSRRSSYLSRGLIAGLRHDSHAALPLGTIVFRKQICLFGVLDEKIQIWNKDIDNERASV